MSKYAEHRKAHWDTVGWFHTLAGRLPDVESNEEWNALATQLASISDEVPFLRKHCRELGINFVLNDNCEAIIYA
ncbi:MAG: hypothetical protein FJ211_09545 [Ignavibacteria bacterium]|nr:hypothetical protein [Ignavibacteria bacterium]